MKNQNLREALFLKQTQVQGLAGISAWVTPYTAHVSSGHTHSPRSHMIPNSALSQRALSTSWCWADVWFLATVVILLSPPSLRR